MKIQINNSKTNDSFIIEAKSIDEIVKIANEECDKRNWKDEDCYSEKIK